MISRFIYTFLFIIWMCGIKSQPLVMHFMDNLPQAAITHPSFFPEYEYSGAIPFTGFNGFDIGTNFPVASLTSNSVTNGILTLDLDKTYDDLKPVTFLDSRLNINMVTSTWVSKNLFFNVNLVNRIQNTLLLPKSFVSLLWEGNAAYVGDELNLSNLGLDFIHFTELSFGITQNINDQFYVGTKFKFLQGLSNINFYRSDLKLQTDTTTYYLTVRSDVKMDISGPFDTNGVTLYSFADYMLNMRNPGFGMDVGLAYKPFKFLRLSFDLTDLGFIYFNSQVKNYSIRNADYQFRGLEAHITSLNFNSDSIISSMIDTVTSIFQPVRTENSYRYFITPQLFAGAEWIINPHHKFTFLYHQRINPAYNYHVLSLGYQLRLGRTFTLMVNGSQFSGNNYRLGIGYNLRLGMFNFYFLKDDILDVIKPLRTQTEGFYFGINFIHYPPSEKKLNKRKARELKREERKNKNK